MMSKTAASALRAAVQGRKDPLSNAIEQVLDELAEAKAILGQVRAENARLKADLAVLKAVRGKPFVNHRSTRPQCAHVAVDKSGTRRQCAFRAETPEATLCRMHRKREAA